MLWREFFSVMISRNRRRNKAGYACGTADVLPQWPRAAAANAATHITRSSVPRWRPEAGETALCKHCYVVRTSKRVGTSSTLDEPSAAFPLILMLSHIYFAQVYPLMIVGDLPGRRRTIAGNPTLLVAAGLLHARNTAANLNRRIEHRDSKFNDIPLYSHTTY